MWKTCKMWKRFSIFFNWQAQDLSQFISHSLALYALSGSKPGGLFSHNNQVVRRSRRALRVSLHVMDMDSQITSVDGIISEMEGARRQKPGHLRSSFKSVFILWLEPSRSALSLTRGCECKRMSIIAIHYRRFEGNPEIGQGDVIVGGKW